ncbi:ROK family transcriptional regulator [Puteibacter caeruleilacunae]|nr:ROK family transcriptional regulator [Puteibacter caeruleilacunae]
MEKLFPKGSAQYINRLNKIKVLNLIRESGEISRADIVKLTGLSAPTITRIVASLIKNEKLAEQVGIGDSKGGRPPMIVRFNGENNYVIGIDWGRTHIFGKLTNLNAEPLAELDVKTEASTDFESDLKKVFRLIEKLLKKSGIDKSQLNGIGIAAAGFINKKTNLVEYSPNFKWTNVDVRKPILERFNVPVIVDNVSRVMALGELHYGIGEKLKDYIFINVGYGIGSGIIMNGKPFYGFDGASGEIGHTRVLYNQRNNRICSCGKMDCLECYSSGRGIEESAIKMIEHYPESSLNDVYNKYNRISAHKVAIAARAGDNLALSIMNQAAEYLGIAVATMANTFNPAAILLGGKIMKSGDYFVNKIEEVFNREKLQQPEREIKIVKSSLGDEAAVKGAISLVLQEILNFNV